MAFCEVCFEKHGAGCLSTHTDDAGRGVCVFCLDGVLCPYMKRFLQAQERPSLTNEENKPVNHSDDVVPIKTNGQTSPATIIAATTPPASRVCSVTDCGTALIEQNKSGFCTRHFHQSKVKNRANGAHVCKALNCGARLLAKNRSGFCHAHFYLSKSTSYATNGRAAAHSAVKLPGKTNGHAIAAASGVDEIRGNGHTGSNGRASLIVAAPANATGDDHTSEARLNSVILAWPLDQKFKAVQAWLSAAI